MAKLRNINRAEYKQLENAPAAIAQLRLAAEAVARNARRRAPKDKGEGAASIHAERVSYGFRVSWDAAHAYMKYPEFGTRTQRAQPHLRPAVTDVKGGR